jgi:hypothetical protein
MGTSHDGGWARLVTVALVLASGCTRRPVELSSMKPKSLGTGDVAIAPIYPFGRMEYAVAAPVGPDRHLVARLFAYSGEQPVLRGVGGEEYGVRAPGGVRLLVAPNGGAGESLPAWVGWLGPGGIEMAAHIHPSSIVKMPLAPGDVPALPPIVVASGHLVTATFARRGDGAQLLVHEAVSAEPAPPLKTDTVLQTAAPPALAASACVPQLRSRDVVIVGWVEPRDRSCKVSVAVVSHGKATTASVDIAGLTPLEGRLALQATPIVPTLEDANLPLGAQIGFVAERAEQGGRAIVKADWDARNGQFHVRTVPLELTSPVPIHSAFVWLPPYINDDRLLAYLLREDGVLMVWKDGRVRSRAGVPLDYAFPIEPYDHEPSVGPDGTIELLPLRWDP